MKVMKRPGTILFFLLQISTVTLTYAQHWKMIGNLGPHATCGFFWNEDRGLVACGGTLDNSGLDTPPEEVRVYTTTNRGVTWAKSAVPPYPSGSFGRINNIWMIDSSNGWLSFVSHDYAQKDFPGIWQTTDGGRTWSALSGALQWHFVRPTIAGILATSFGGIAFLDSAHGLKTEAASPGWNGSPGNSQSSTSDGGKSWTPNSSDYVESWGVAYSQHFGQYFICPEGSYSMLGIAGNVYSTPDDGITWARLGSVPNPTGDVESSGACLYIQDRGTGIYRSLDGGASFEFVGGPWNVRDTRFCTFPTCRGGGVVAFDTGGGVWLTTDGGDGSLPELPSIVAVTRASISSCDIARIPIVFQSSTCDWLKISRIALSGDSTGSFILEGADSVLVGTGLTDTIYIDYIPHHSIVPRTVVLNISGQIDADGTIKSFDSTYTILGTPVAQAPKLTASANFVNLGTVSTCSQVDTTISLRNSGCDTLQIDSLTGISTSDLRLSGVASPLRIAPDSSITLRLHFAPSIAGPLYQDLVYHTSQEGLSATLELIIQAAAIAGTGKLILSKSEPVFPPTSICTSDSTSFTFYNSGCDTLVISSENLTGDSDFTSDAVGQSMLARGDSVTVHIYLNPKLKGLRVASYSLKSHSIKDPSSEQDTTILFSATIISGNRICSIDSALRNFGVGSVCRVADTTIIFKNIGCDSMAVHSVVVNGQNFTLLSSNAPKQLAPGMSDTIRVAYLPTSAGNDSATLLLQTNADQDSVVNIPFSAKTVAPQRLTLQTSLSRNNIPTGDTTRLFVTPAQTITVAGLTSLSCTISYDGDLLTYIPNTIVVASGFTAANPVETRSGKTSTLKVTLSTTGNPTTFTKAASLASVRFETTLTDSLSAPIVLGNIILNNGDSLFNKCSLSITDTSTNFTLALNCFDSTINAALRGVLPFVVQSIVPNPTNEKLTVTLMTESKQPVVYELYDALGHDVKRGSFGEAVNTLDLSSLLSGSYYLRMTGSGEIQSRRIVLQR